MEHLNGEIKRRTEVGRHLLGEAASTRLVAAILLEQNDESSGAAARYMTLETIAPLRDDLSLMLAAAAAWTTAARPTTEIPAQLPHHVRDHDRPP